MRKHSGNPASPPCSNSAGGERFWSWGRARTSEQESGPPQRRCLTPPPPRPVETRPAAATPPAPPQSGTARGATPAPHRQRRRRAGRLPGQPALRDLAQERVARRVAGHVPPRHQQPVHRPRHQAAIRHRHRRQLRRQRRRDADLVLPRRRIAPPLARHPRHARQPPRMAHAELRRRQHQERLLEARRMRAVHRRGAAPSAGASAPPPRSGPGHRPRNSPPAAVP